jgi:hypothetical protein
MTFTMCFKDTLKLAVFSGGRIELNTLETVIFRVKETVLGSVIQMKHLSSGPK